MALDPDSLSAKVDIATLYLFMNDTDSSIKEFNEILKMPIPHHQRPVYASIYLRLGDLYFNTGNNKAALRAWGKVYTDFKDQIWFNAIAKFLIGKTSLEELLSKTASWQPDFKVICYYYIGMKYEMEGDIETAKAYYRKSADVPSQTFQLLKALAGKRLRNLEESSDPGYK